VETCYRHPGRETGVSCSSCGRPICPECMTPTPVGMRCPECSRQRTKVKTAATITRGEDPVATYVLMGICVALGLGSVFAGGEWLSGGTDRLSADLGLYGPYVADGEIWRVLTSGFLHAGPFHLLVNMYSLWILGTMLEPSIGRLRFVLIYFVSLLAGSFGALLVSPEKLTVGASGAIFGLMGAAVMVLRNRGIDPMQSGLPLWIGINLIFTFTFSDRISVGGHVGGLIGGALAAIVIFDLAERVRKMPPAVPLVLAGALGAAAVVGSVVVA
jgi:membrane associated rhomboid family serine protease